MQLLLHTLSEKEIVDSYELSVEIGKDHQLIVGAIKSLQSMGDVRVVMLSLAWPTQPNPEMSLDGFLCVTRECELNCSVDYFDYIVFPSFLPLPSSLSHPPSPFLSHPPSPFLPLPSSLSLPPSPFLPLPSLPLPSLPLPSSPSLSLPPSPSPGD